MPDSSFPVTVLDGHAVVTTPDEIDIANAVLFREALLSAAEPGRATVVVDMTGTEFCDSTGLSVLVRALRQADQDGSQLRLVVHGSALRRILSVSGIGSMFSIYETLSQALEAA